MATPPRGPHRLFFDLWSLFYDLAPVQALVYRPVHDAVVERLRPLGTPRVLDIGCGTGLLTARLRRELPATQVTGCDFSAGMLAQAAGRDRSGPWVRGDAQRLPFAAARFEAVVCTESFHWYPDQQAAVAEFFRVLVPGGRVMIETVNPPFEVFSLAARRLSELTGEPFTWPTRARLRAGLEAVGFRVEEQRQILRLPAPVLLPGVLTVAHRPG